MLSDKEVVAGVSTSFGSLLIFSVLDETKIGVRPGAPTGNRGGDIGSLTIGATGVGAGVVSLLLLLNCSSLWR